MSDGPLDGLRVLDFGWVWSAPMVAGFLADLGAEVIKVEHNERLDNARLRGRPTIDGETVEGPKVELVPYFQMNNRGKKGITVNMKTDRGVELLAELAAESDVVVENYTPGTMAEMGLGYEDLAAENDELVMLSMSPAGQYGPLSGIRAYAPIMTSLAGIESTVGYPGEDPLGMLTFGYGDPNAASHALFALLAALHRRERTGEGDYIDFSQLEAQLSVFGEPILETEFSGEPPEPAGNAHPTACPYGAYPAAGDDEWVSIVVTDESEWERFAAVVDEPWVAEDRFADATSRHEHEAALDELVADWTRERDREAAARELADAGVPAAPVQRIEEVMEDDGFDERGLTVTVEHAYLDEVTVFAVPWRFSETTPAPQGPAPLVGEHNDEVFGDVLGLTSGEIDRLKDEEVIY